MRSREIVLITGCARSGTSMVAGVLQACGLDLGPEDELVGPTRWNPNGFKEHKKIRQKVLKPLLRELGADPRGQGRLPPRGAMVLPARVAKLRRAVNVRLNGGRGYKDAKVLLVWRIFYRAFPAARWILVRRDPMGIVDSCIRCDFMTGRKYKAGWISWMQEHELRMADLKASGANVVEVWPDPDEVESFKPAIKQAGVVWDEKAIRGALVPDAWHRRKVRAQ